MSAPQSPIRPALITGNKTYSQITADILRPIEAAPTKGWLIGLGISSALLGVYLVCWGLTLVNGIGMWGANPTVNWAFDITNFVFWVGIGHAGTLISAILLLFRQRWRNSIARAAEAMTIFAVICAGVFPLLHAGRPWVIFWVFPLPNTHGSLWVNFNSPLLWDVFAISTYLTVSAVFWFMGLIPDFGTLRDRMRNPIARKIYGVLSFGWTGSAKSWQRFESISLILAGLCTPLVLSVHTIVSFDFATSVIPGWHTTIFPPYFVAGAIFSGFGMVLTLMIVARTALKIEDYITIDHIDSMAKICLATGMMVGLAYGTEFFIAWYSGSYYEGYAFLNRAFGPYWWAYWSMVSCNVISPQFFWFKKLRRNLPFVFVLSIFINIGMWFERFVIIVTSLHRDFLPSSWKMYTPSLVEAGIMVGSFGLFMTLFLLFTKFVPVIAIAEVKAILKSSGDQYHKHVPTDQYDLAKPAVAVPAGVHHSPDVPNNQA
jgi:molybdopterin-containing oxidoreductase family membrane subunit